MTGRSLAGRAVGLRLEPQAASPPVGLPSLSLLAAGHFASKKMAYRVKVELGRLPTGAKGDTVGKMIGL